MARIRKTAIRTTKSTFVIALAALFVVGLTTTTIVAIAANKAKNNSTSVLGTQLGAQPSARPSPRGATPTPPGKSPLTITGTTTTDLVPGRSVPIALTLTNPNNQDVTVSRVTVTVDEQTKIGNVVIPGCTGSANIEVLSDYTGPDLVVPKNGSVSVANPSVSGPWILMKDSAQPQDACKGVTFSFSFSAMARSN